MQIQTVPIEQLRPHPENPRVHPDSAIEKLTRSLKEFGFTNPIAAITELNKMDGVYREGMTVNIDNRKLEIVVSSLETKKLLGEIEKGVEPHADSQTS